MKEKVKKNKGEKNWGNSFKIRKNFCKNIGNCFKQILKNKKM